MSANPDPNPKSGIPEYPDRHIPDHSQALDPNESYSFMTDAEGSISEDEIGDAAKILKPDEEVPDHGDASEMAYLIGFDRKPQTADITHGMMEADQAESEKTPLPLYANPYVKFPLLIAVVGVGIGVIGSFFLGGGPEDKPKVATKVDTPAATTAFEDNSDGKAKADLALGKELNKELASKQAPATATVPATPVGIPPNPTTVKPVNPIAPTAAATPAPSIAATPIVKKTEPLAVRPAPIARSYPVPAPQSIPTFNRTTVVAQPIVAKPIVVKAPAIKPTPKLSPKTAIAMKSYPASYPQPAPISSRPEIQPLALSWEKVSEVNASYGGYDRVAMADTKSADSNPAVAPTPSVPKKAPVNSAGEAGVLTSIAPRASIGTIPVGRSVSGVLVTPFQMLVGKENEATATIQINKPLIATNGNILMLPGAQITFKMTLTSDNGYLSGTATQASIRGVNVDLPPGSISIQSGSNSPLVAENYQFGTSQIRDRDALNFFYSAAANVGAVLTAPTQTTSNTSSSNGGFSSSNSTTSNPSVIGAILQGGFNPLATAVQNRNAIEIERILKGTRLWQLPVGTPVQVNVINQFSL